MKILGIETSCDDTAASVVEDGSRVLSACFASELEQHVSFGGVVPEIASRAHLELITPVYVRALAEAGLSPASPPDAVAATIGPGQIGALLVGVSTAKALAFGWDVPFIGVNHLEGHLYAAFLEEPDLEFPLVVLLVSGGHTMIVEMVERGRYRILGQTVDDAAGEAFDKVGRMMGLAYPSGPIIDKLSASGNAHAFQFPRALRERPYDFSFSGLKTAVMHALQDTPGARTEDIAASFQEAVVDVLVTKTMRAAADSDAKGICLGGGVAANSALRQRMQDVGNAAGLRVFLPSRSLCTDNAAMIASAAWHRWQSDGPTPLSIGANPRLKLPTIEE